MQALNHIKNTKISKDLIKLINIKANNTIAIMEVCGTHTNTILKSGIKDLLPHNIKLINGPGCPVCVTPQGYIDTAIDISRHKDIIVTTFGDLMRVPGSKSTLNNEKALGNNIKVVYSPLDSLKIAEDNPEKSIVFLAIGFETTAPIIALSILMAKHKNIHNYYVLNSLKTMPEAMKTLVLNPEVKIDGFLCPGHVGTIIGVKPFESIAKEFKVPMVVSGFEVNDILASILKIIEMNENEEYRVNNYYARLVKYEGNKKAMDYVNEVFEASNSIWRGLGTVNNAGLRLKEKYTEFDITNKINIQIKEETKNNACNCGQILMGLKEPIECKLFGKVCTPSMPLGPCMVSEEGSCAAYYKYRL